MKSKIYKFSPCPITDKNGRQIATALRPIIEIVLTLDNKSRLFSGLIDTGADLCIFPAWIAKHFGHNLLLGKERTIKGLCGSTKAYKHTTFISVFDAGFRCDSYYSEDKDINNLGFGILGFPFLINFEVEFRYPDYFKISERKVY
ncbi:MAG: hypothetical protein V2A65_11395 [Candidatus Omnitrophota bacterium]